MSSTGMEGGLCSHTAPMLPTTAPAIAPVALTRLSSTSMATGQTAQPG